MRPQRRQLLARLGLATGVLAFILGISIASRAQENGQVSFTNAGCARCHSVEAAKIEATVSERMRGPDLSTVGNDHDAAWIVSVVKQETELDGRPHRAPFRGTDEQLSAIAAWLVGLE